MDFKLAESQLIDPLLFEAFYGTDNDGDILNDDSFVDFVKERTRIVDKVSSEAHYEPISLVLCDGGIDVDKQENRQEELSLQLLYKQTRMALELLSEGGRCVFKFFDTFRTETVQLIYLISICFKKICIMKPLMSRPANSEKYLICFGKLKNVNHVCDFIKNDFTSLLVGERFNKYMSRINEELADRQFNAIDELIEVSKNGKYCVEDRSKSCLVAWKIPTIPGPIHDNIYERFEHLANDVDIIITLHSTVVIDKGEFAKKIRCDYWYRFDHCNARLYFIFNGSIFVYDSVDGPVCKNGWRHVSRKNCSIPNDSIFLGTILDESIELLDAMVLGGVSVGNYEFKFRYDQCLMFAKQYKLIVKPCCRVSYIKHRLDGFLLNIARPGCRTNNYDDITQHGTFWDAFNQRVELFTVPETREM